jgi:quinol monooxygenase YgiN
MELFIFGRFHAREGCEAAVAGALREVAGPSRAAEGCLSLQVYRSVREPRLFYVHSRWVSEAAVRSPRRTAAHGPVLERVQPLIDHPLDVTRARPIE